MAINEKVLKHWIENFYGYGSWDAKFWFISYEEGGGDLPEEVSEKIDYFYQVNDKQEGSLCDLREVLKEVKVGSDRPKIRTLHSAYKNRFGENAILYGPRKNLSTFRDG